MIESSVAMFILIVSLVSLAGFVYVKGISLGMQKAANRIAGRELTREEADQIWLELEMKRLAVVRAEPTPEVAQYNALPPRMIPFKLH